MAEAPPKARRWFQRHPKTTLFFLILVLAILAVAGAEKLLGYLNARQGIDLDTEPRYIRLKEYRPHSRLRLSFPPHHLPYTDNVFTRKFPLEIDGDGFIMPSRRHDRADFSLVFLGGSTTECMYMDPEQRFPYLAGVLLEEATGRQVNSYNAGMSGSNSLNALDVLLNKVVHIQPQAAVFMENINEISTLLYEGTYWNHNSARSPVETLKKHKLAGKLLKEAYIPNLNHAWRQLKRTWRPEAEEDEFAHARGKKLAVDQARLAAQFTRNLAAFICLCRAYGITPVLMTQANRITANPDAVVAAYIGRDSRATGLTYEQFKELYDAFNDAIRHTGRQYGVRVIDLAKDIPPTKEYLYDLVHFNDAGSRLAAQCIAAQLKELVHAAKH